MKRDWSALWWLGMVWLVGFLGIWWMVTPAPAQESTAPCHDVRVNAKGAAGASIAVSTAVVAIVDANPSRCRLTIANETANPVKCAESTGKYVLTPSATVGLFIPGNTVLEIPSQAGQQAWSCIRQGGTDSAVSVAEDLP